MRERTLFSLDGKVILVTGGYGHLGKSVCLGLAQHGAQVSVLGKDKKKFKAAFGKHMNKSITFEPCDVRSTDSIAKSFAKIIKDKGRIDVLINNAIYLQGKSSPFVSDPDWKVGIDGGLGSVYRCVREISHFMIKQGSGKIINVSSMYGFVSPDFGIYEGHESFFNPPQYGAAKAGVIQLTKYFAILLGKNNILVNCVSPGPFPSEKVQKDRIFIGNLKKKSPLGRIGKPDELVGIFVFLSSNASSYITGQNIFVDGGWTAW